MNRAFVAAGVPPAVERGVSPPGIPGSWAVNRSIRTERFPSTPHSTAVLNSPRIAAVDPLLKLIRDNAALQPSQLAALLGIPETEVTTRIKAFEQDRVILGYRTVLNEEKLGRDIVRAVIEVKITPERGGGFDRLADRIAKYSEVESCYLMSGGYDLLVIVVGSNLREVAAFVSEKLSTIQGVISTATHFLLKPYKEQGVLTSGPTVSDRLPVTP
jgi:DNA-binding Lrp family transcriptional regulator